MQDLIQPLLVLCRLLLCFSASLQVFCMLQLHFCLHRHHPKCQLCIFRLDMRHQACQCRVCAGNLCSAFDQASPINCQAVSMLETGMAMLSALCHHKRYIPALSGIDPTKGGQPAPAELLAPVSQEQEDKLPKGNVDIHWQHL